MFDNIVFNRFEFGNSLSSGEMFREDFVRRAHLNEHDAGRIAELQSIQGFSCVYSGTQDAIALPLVKYDPQQPLYYVQQFGYYHSGAVFYIERTYFDAYLVLFTYSGSGVLEYEGKRYTLREGEGAFIDCRRPHRYQTQEPAWEHSELHVNGGQAAALWKLFAERKSPVFRQPVQGPYQQDLEHLLRACQGTLPYKPWRVSQRIDTLLTELLVYSALEKPITETQEAMNAVLNFMQQHFSEPITLDKLCEVSHFSKSYLSKTFKEYMGFTPVDYLIRLRIEHACTLLVSTALPVGTVGQLVGIEDPNNFGTQFRRVVGVTPSVYRKSMRKK